MHAIVLDAVHVACVFAILVVLLALRGRIAAIMMTFDVVAGVALAVM